MCYVCGMQKGQKWGLIAIGLQGSLTILSFSDSLMEELQNPLAGHCIPANPGVYTYAGDQIWKKASLEEIARWLQNG